MVTTFDSGFCLENIGSLGGTPLRVFRRIKISKRLKHFTFEIEIKFNLVNIHSVNFLLFKQICIPKIKLSIQYELPGS